HEDVIQLFQHFRRHLNVKEKGLEKEKVFKAIYPKSAFNMQQLHYLSSYLLKVVEEYLAWKEWRGDGISFRLSLLKAYQNHLLSNQHRAKLDETKALHESNNVKNSQYFRQAYEIQFEEYNSANVMGKSKDFNLQALIDAQDTAYIYEKLKNACLLLSQKAVARTNYSPGLLPDVLTFLQSNPINEEPSIAVYYHAYQALSNAENIDSFNELKRLLSNSGRSIQASELRDLYMLAINFCIRRLNTGDQGYLREVFELYQGGLELGIFIENGFFSPSTYSNYVISGIRLGEFDKVEDFINQYKNLLSEKLQEGLFRYNYAFLHYEKHDYKQAMFYLSTTDYGKDPLTTCAAKTLLSRMYFEQKEYETLTSLLQSFKAFLNRKEIIGYHKELYSNFVLMLQKLMHAKLSRKELATVEIATELETMKVVAAKDWLLEQTKSLKTKK
ncbi:MAG: hypothetical protein IT258_05335, partial [Saprospiraceae bacterium]|nr:hypothetical protein [Saprospiraceae bacterium]